MYDGFLQKQGNAFQIVHRVERKKLELYAERSVMLQLRFWSGFVKKDIFYLSIWQITMVIDGFQWRFFALHKPDDH